MEQTQKNFRSILGKLSLLLILILVVGLFVGLIQLPNVKATGGSFGYTTIGSAFPNYTESAGYFTMWNFTLGSQQTFSSESIYLNQSSSGGNFYLYMYNSSLQLAACTIEGTLASGLGWQTLSFYPYVTLSAGTYLMGFVASVDVNVFIDNGDAEQQQWKAVGFETPPATIGSFGGDGAYKASIYANYTTAPAYSNLNTNTATEGIYTAFNSTWQDGVGLASTGGYILSTNNSGTWANSSWAAFSSNPQTVSVPKVLATTVQQIIGYKWYANNTNNDWTETITQTIKLHPQSTFNGIWCGVADITATFLQDCVKNQTFDIFMNVGYADPASFPSLSGIVPVTESPFIGGSAINTALATVASVSSQLKVWAWVGTYPHNESGQVDISNSSNQAALVSVMVQIAQMGFVGIQDDTEDQNAASTTGGQYNINYVNYANSLATALHVVGLKLVILVPDIWNNFNINFASQFTGVDYIVVQGGSTQTEFTSLLNQFMTYVNVTENILMPLYEAGSGLPEIGVQLPWIAALPYYSNIVGYAIYYPEISALGWQSWDNILPLAYSDISVSTTTKGASCKFNITVNHAVALNPNGQSQFGTNNTGSWVWDSAVNFTSTPQNISVTKTLNNTFPNTVAYEWNFTNNVGSISTTGLNYLSLTNTNTYTATLTITNPTATNYTSSSIPVQLSSSGNDTNPIITYNLKFSNASWLYGSNQTYTVPTSMTILTNETNALFCAKVVGDNGATDYQTVSFNISLIDNMPIFSLHTFNTTSIGSNCSFGVTVTDDIGLSYYIFSTNNTGQWVNGTTTAFSSNPQTISTIKTLNSTVGVLIQWIWYANDSTNKWATSATQSLTTTDDTIPSFGSILSNTTLAGNATQISVTISDNVAVSSWRCAWNNTGTWVNNSVVIASGVLINALFNGTFNSTVGNKISIQFWANDSSNNGAYSSIYTVTLTNLVYTASVTITNPTNTTYTNPIIPVQLSSSGNDTNQVITWNVQFSNGTWLYGANQTYTIPTTMTIAYNATNALFCTKVVGDNGASDYKTVTFSVGIPDIYAFISVSFRDLDAGAVLTPTWQLYNSTTLLTYSLGDYTLKSGTYTLKTYYYGSLVNTTNFDTATYGNSSLTVYLQLKQGTIYNIALNDTVTSLTINSENSTHLNFTVTGAGGPYTIIIPSSDRATYIAKSGVNQTYGSIWTFDLVNHATIISTATLSEWDIDWTVVPITPAQFVSFISGELLSGLSMIALISIVVAAVSIIGVILVIRRNEGLDASEMATIDASQVVVPIVIVIVVVIMALVTAVIIGLMTGFI